MFDTLQSVVGRSEREPPSSGIGKDSDAACRRFIVALPTSKQDEVERPFNETGPNDLGLQSNCYSRSLVYIEEDRVIITSKKMRFSLSFGRRC